MRCATFFCIFFLVLLVSCEKKQELYFNTQDHDNLSYLPDFEWIVVQDSVSAVYSDSSFDSPVLLHARKGDVYQVNARRVFSEKTEDGEFRTVLWYGISSEGADGWLIEECVSVYKNEMSAKNAAQNLERQ